jgi:hypothetical protein
MPSDHTHAGAIIPEVEVELEVEKDMLKQVADLTAFIIRSIMVSYLMQHFSFCTTQRYCISYIIYI